jgi:hypothetical protein
MQDDHEWQAVEQAFATDRQTVIRAFMLGRGLDVAQTRHEIHARSGVPLPPDAILVELKSLLAKTPARDLRGKKTRLIPLFYGQSSMRGFLALRTPFLSCQEISETILKDTGIPITRKGIWAAARRLGIKTQEQREAFNRAVDKKRFDHNRIAAKIDYKKRKVDYGSFQSKRMMQLRSHPKGGGAFAFGLKDQMRLRKITHATVATALGVSAGCVRGWCALNNRISPSYWHRLCRVLEVTPDAIFKVAPTEIQRTKFAGKLTY